MRGTGGGRACNLPVPPRFNDTGLAVLLDRVVLPLGWLAAPHAVVITCGADALDGDPLSTMALSNVALWRPRMPYTAAKRAQVS